MLIYQKRNFILYIVHILKNYVCVKYIKWVDEYKYVIEENGLRTAEYEMKLRKEILILCEILIIAAFIYTYIVYGISRPDKGEVCIYDNILYSEYYGFEMILLIFLLVIIQADLRSSHRCAVIIRYKSIRHYWNNICKNITAKCMEMTSILLINIIGLCIILKIFNAY